MGCLFLTHGTTDKGWAHGYNRIYDRVLKEVKDRKGADVVKLLEVGVFRGSSMKVWEEYFTAEPSHFYGLSYGSQTFYSPDVADDTDYAPEDDLLLNTKTTLFYGSQSERADLMDVKSKLPDMDVIIDDGSHDPLDQLEQPLGVGSTMNIVDLFLKTVHYAKYVNNAFLGSKDSQTRAEWNVETREWIENVVQDVGSVEFAYNMVLIRKKTEIDDFYEYKNRNYYHKQQTKINLF
ncbi:hypothetical protein TL16_g10176 [Triparma laevis f. inornata]|uniref:Uncharacterized protein n=1 Tax=Triparma laevis f. inornata TaxID=1714386 RepID=A0A9W7EN42_9STRA|nr:hypothetical protein TL16_g10176 [Triparma laevis f. inornata]